MTTRTGSDAATPTPGLTVDGYASGDRLIPDGPPRQPDPDARRSRALTLGSVIALFVLCVAWELWLAPTGSGTLAIKALPLLLPVLGLMRYRLYTFRWLSLLIWLYVGEGLLRLSSEGGLSRWLAVAEVLLSLAVFWGCVWHVRARLKHLHADASTGPSSPSVSGGNA